MNFSNIQEIQRTIEKWEQRNSAAHEDAYPSDAYQRAVRRLPAERLETFPEIIKIAD